MPQDLRGFAQFISFERGMMLFMISVGATFLTSGALALVPALLLGAIAFCGWSAVDAMNNIFDADLDALSDPTRAKFTRSLGRTGILVAVGFTVLSIALGTATLMPFVVLFTGLGILFGILYSVPPFRLRKTPYKSIVNFTVGAVPIMIIAAFFNTFSINILTLTLLIGVTTAVNSLWEDLADYASDFRSGSKTAPIILGFKRGLLLTVALGYLMVPLMALVGVLFSLPWIYYVALAGLTAFITARLISNRKSICRKDSKNSDGLFNLGKVLSKDFAVVAVVFTLMLMLSSVFTINPIL
jgi:4-hydroxybenzoate polyprenyltransferase